MSDPRSVEPDDIAGADLPDWMHATPNHNAIVGAAWAVMLPVAVVVVWQLWLHFDTVWFWMGSI